VARWTRTTRWRRPASLPLAKAATRNPRTLAPSLTLTAVLEVAGPLGWWLSNDQEQEPG
jgi:hypothetical protein